jgi:hypothetical protein
MIGVRGESPKSKELKSQGRQKNNIMTTKVTAHEALNRIQEAAKESTDEIRFHRTVPIGKIVHQGDVYLKAIKEPALKGKPANTKQLAPGTTKGSRHIVKGKNIEIYESTKSEELLGPIVHAPERFELTHPEHAHHSIPSGWYETGYQVDMQTKLRVLD